MWYGSAPANVFQVTVTDANKQVAIQQFCLGTFYATPVVAAVTPSAITADGLTHILTVAGSNFRSASTVYLYGVPLSTQFVDSNHLTITLLPSTKCAAGQHRRARRSSDRYFRPAQRDAITHGSKTGGRKRRRLCLRYRTGRPAQSRLCRAT